VTVRSDPVLAVGAETDGLSVLERDQHVRAVLLAVYRLERAVVEDVAVLVDLDKRGPTVVVRTAETSSTMCLRSRSMVSCDEKSPQRRERGSPG